MLTRQDLKQFNFENPPDFALQRTEEVQKKYDEYMLDKRNTLGFLDIVREKMEGKKFCLLKNDFPYDIEEGITHLVCWYTEENPHAPKYTLNGKGSCGIMSMDSDLGRDGFILDLKGKEFKIINNVLEDLINV